MPSTLPDLPNIEADLFQVPGADLVDRYSERRESAEALSQRVNFQSL